jgi:hypothetical protein
LYCDIIPAATGSRLICRIQAYRPTKVAYAMILASMLVIGILLIFFTPPTNDPNRLSPVAWLWWGRHGWADDDAALRTFLREALDEAERAER